jgi:alpha-galactosidase
LGYVHRCDTFFYCPGLKLGIYSDTALQTCASYVASGGHEVEDAQQFADWEVDLLKYDNCFVTPEMVSQLSG